VESRRGYERGQTVDQLERLESDVAGAVAPAVAQLVQELAVVQPAQPLGRDGWASDVTAQPLESVAVVGRHGDAGVQAEAVDRVAGTGRKPSSGGNCHQAWRSASFKIEQFAVNFGGDPHGLGAELVASGF
jgi:hypothetical protein